MSEAVDFTKLADISRLPAGNMNAPLPKTGRKAAGAPAAGGERAPTMASGPLGALPLLWFEDIAPVLEARDFVQGVLAEQSAVVVYGASHAGKTFWTTDLALHVAAGMPWNGRRVEQGGVVYGVLEGGGGFKNRVAAWRRAHATQGAEVAFAAIPSAINLLDPEADTPRLIATIKAAAARMQRPVKLVVIDTLSRAMSGGDENSPNDMGALVRNMDAVREATGAALLFVHHSGKDAAKGARGHSLLRAAVDTEIEVVADTTTKISTATVAKQRDMQKAAPFVFRLDTVVIGQNAHGEDVTTCVVRPDDAAADGRAAAPGKTRDVERRLSDANGLLLHALRDAVAGDEVEHVIPIPGMPRVAAVKRPILRATLIQAAWYRPDELREGVSDPGNAVERRGQTREHKALEALKAKSLAGFTREWAWLV